MCTLGHFRKKSAMAAISITNDLTDEEVATHFSGLRSFNVSQNMITMSVGREIVKDYN